MAWPCEGYLHFICVCVSTLYLWVIEVCTSQPIDQARWIQNVGGLQELSGFAITRVTSSAGGKTLQDSSSALGSTGAINEDFVEDVPHSSLG